MFYHSKRIRYLYTKSERHLVGLYVLNILKYEPLNYVKYVHTYEQCDI